MTTVKHCPWCLTAEDAPERLALWEWLTDMRLTVVEVAIDPQDIEAKPWLVADVDGDPHGVGDTPEDAIRDAQRNLEGK